MKPRCAHDYANVYNFKRFGTTCIRIVCRKCRDCLPLGPAKLDGEHAEAVAVEIRATELSNLAESHADHVECDGWFRADDDAHHERPPHLDEKRWLAGWFGRLIYEHNHRPEPRPLTLDDVKDALAAGAVERRAAERGLKRSPRR